MALTPGSVKIGINFDLENPKCPRAELEPLLDAAYQSAKSKIFASIEIQGGADGGSCTPHDKVTFDKSTCP